MTVISSSSALAVRAVEPVEQGAENVWIYLLG